MVSSLVDEKATILFLSLFAARIAYFHFRRLKPAATES
jgi:hypothetical protein